MEEILSKINQISLLLQKSRKGIAILPELNRFRNILSFCDNFNIDEGKVKPSLTLPHKNSEQLQDATEEVSPGNNSNKSPFMRNNVEFNGLMSQHEKNKESLLYIQLTLNSCISLLQSNLVALQQNICDSGFKLAYLGLVHRLRISRLLILLNLMSSHVVHGYLDSLDKCEALNLLHNLQTVISDKTVIDRFTYTTFEQAAYGIDTFHTVVKIKRLLKEAQALKSGQICNHREVGLLLDSYFQQHSQINIDLLLNAVVLHYQVSKSMQTVLLHAFQQIFHVRQANKFVSVQEFILLTDFVSIPQLLYLLENGEAPHYITVDLLLKDLKAPQITDYSLLKSFSKVEADLNQDTIIQRLIAFNTISLQGIKFGLPQLGDQILIKCELLFENTIDESSFFNYLSHFEENANIQKQIQPKSNNFDSNHVNSQRTQNKHHTAGIKQASRVISRYQQYLKQRMLEIIDLETREKELQTAMAIQVDSLTSYKPFTHPNLVKFNEEISGDILSSQSQEEQLLREAHASRSNMLLSDIIKRLEKTNLQSEKLGQLRKLQKQKEKQQILSEKIEVDSSGPPNSNLQHQPILNRLPTSNLNNYGQNMVNRQVSNANEERKQMAPSDFGNFDNNRDPSTFRRPPTILMMTPNTLMNQSTVAIVPDRTSVKSKENMQFEYRTQSKLLSRLHQCKTHLLLQIEHFESLLLLSDGFFSCERGDIIRSMRHHDRQILENEKSIRDMLSEIAGSEMRRNIVSDELEENILRTIEIINISDIKIERENLERENIDLEKKQAELEKIESELSKEKEKIEEKKRRRRQVVNNQPKLNTKTIDSQA